MANALEQIGQLIRAGRFNDAERACQQVLAQAPDQPHTHYFLGMIAMNRGDFGEAVTRFDAAIAQLPEVVEFHLNRGVALLRDRQFDLAEQALLRCIELKADDAWAMANLAMLANERGQLEESVAWLRKAVAAQPTMWEFQYNLANALRRIHHHEEANELYQDVLEVRGDFQPARNNMASGLRAQGRVTEANATFRRMTKLAPRESLGWQNLLLGRQYDQGGSASETHELALKWAQELTRDIQPMPEPEIDRTPGRRLRIAFVGVSFHQHPHGYFLQPLLEHLDRKAFEVHVFSQRAVHQVEGDPVRAQLEQLADHWHDTQGLAPELLAERVRSEGIDILIDTTRHLEGSQLLALAYRPAPVQVSWLGGPQITTGLPMVDYLLTDAQHVPEKKARYYTEQVVRLAGDYVCWQPPHDAPAPAAQPASAAHGEPITFGCFANLAKIARPTIATWGRIMAELPGARLLIKSGPLVDEATANRWREIFERAGVASDRLVLEGGAPHAEFLAAYDRVDVALDTFPYAGGVTTLEALWMGVPVISMAWSGNPVASHGASHLPAAGCAEMLAADADDYVAKAVALAGDAARLAEYRQTLRDRVARSAMCDGAAYAAKFGDALQAMWADV